MAADVEIEKPGIWAITLSSLKASLARPSLWLFTWGVILVASFPFAFAYHQGVTKALSNNYAPGSQLGWFTTDFFRDHASELESLSTSASTGFGILALLMPLVGAFFAGGWLQILLERTSGRSLRRFLWGGARTFWRFVRVWLFFLAFFLLVSWLFYGVVFDKYVLSPFGANVAEDLPREDYAFWWKVLQATLLAISYFKLKVWATYTRTRLALLNTRSVMVAGIACWWMMLRHPMRTFGPMLLLLLVQLPVVGLMGFVSADLDGGLDSTSGWRVILVMFALNQVALLWGEILFGARYSAAVQVCRSLIRASVEPDPFADRVGGPGGPQYPIDDSDEYGVSY